MFLPDRDRSRALLVGTARYIDDALPDLPGVANNVVDLFELFTGSRYGILPASGCEVVVDPSDVPTFGNALHRAASAATDTLIVYYAGHGLLGSNAQGLYLSVAGSSQSLPRFTALPIEIVKQTIHESPAQHRVLLLDCCFSGRAIAEAMSGPRDAILGQLIVPGIYLMTSAPANRPAMAPEGARHTAFTGSLIEAVRHGVAEPNDAASLTLDGVYHLLTRHAQNSGLPEPRQQMEGSTGRLLLARAGTLPAPAAAAAAGTTVSARDDRVVAEFRQRPDGSRVGELLDQEIARVLASIGFPVVPTDVDPGEISAEVEWRLGAYERELARLVRMVAATVVYGDQGDTGWLPRRLARLLSARADGLADAVGELVAAQAYPALLVSYSVGVAARLSGRDAVIHTMLSWSIERLLPFRVVASTVVDEFPGWSSGAPTFGLSVRLRRALEPAFTETHAAAEYSSAFAEYEYLRSLFELHALDFSALGEFAVGLGRGRNAVDDRVAPSLTAGSSLMRAGAFGGDAAIAADVRQRLLALVRGRFG